MQLSSKAVRIFKIIVAVIAAMLLFLVGVLKYLHINAQYPPPKRIEHHIGERFQYQEIELSILDFELYTFEEFVEEYDIETKNTSLILPDTDQKNAVVTLHLKNNGKMIRELDTAGMMLLQTDGWTGYADLMDLFYALNPDISPTIRLRPGSEVTLYFGYSLYDMHFSKIDYDNLFSKPFYIVLQIYPVKNIISLDA